MEVSVTQENLAKALANVGRVASSKTGLPILGNILLRTDGKNLFLAATNLEIASTQIIGAKIIKAGSITIPSKLITEFIHNLTKGTINLTVKNNHLHIVAEKTKTVINGVVDEEFPELPIIDEKNSITYKLSVSDFKNAVSQTIITASHDSTRPALTGVYWYTHNKQLYLAATDGYRLSEKKLIAVKNTINAIVPTLALQEVIRTINEETIEIEVIFNETQIRFRLNENEITSKLIDGNFPDYRKIIPETTNSICIINKDEFSRIVKITSLFSRDSGGTITLTIDNDKQSLTVKSITSELGENTSEIDAKVTGATGSISLNSHYLNDALNVLEDDEISFGFSGKLAPAVLSSTKKDDYTHIIMPIKS